MLSDEALLEVFLSPVRKCASYTPAFGKMGRGEKAIGFEGFEALYGNDAFYSWLGLDHKLVYAAHKASGGLTSLYRQIGVGSERLFKAVLKNQLGLTDEMMNWHYEYSRPRGEKGVHTLDARIRRSDLDSEVAERFGEWLDRARDQTHRSSGVNVGLDAVVFEVRQGYKSADSKRQNADLRFGMRAYRDGLVPALAVMSNQVSEPVIKRYREDGILVLTGSLEDDPVVSTFSFFDRVVGYDLKGFLARNSSTLRSEIERIVETLLSVE